MKLQVNKLPEIKEWNNDRPPFPVGYVVQYHNAPHQVIDCTAEGQGFRLAAIETDQQLRADLDAAREEIADFKRFKGDAKGEEYRNKLLSKDKESLVAMIIDNTATWLQQEYDKGNLKAENTRLKEQLKEKENETD